MTTHIEPIPDIKDIVPLLAGCGLPDAACRMRLAGCGLPVSDISAEHAPQFFGIRADGKLVAIVGLECFGTVGLLRSLAVDSAQRGQGLARQLVAYAERTAAAQGVAALFLLTTTAADFFGKLGYAAAPRSAAPSAIQATRQFAELCPASSALLVKSVAG